MSIKTGSISKFTTLDISTGGTPHVVTPLGDTLTECNVSYDASTYAERPTITYTVKRPKDQPSAPNGKSQARSQVLVRVPKTLSNGAITYNTIKCEIGFDMETSQTEINTLRTYIAQMLLGSDFSPFWEEQSVE